MNVWKSSWSASPDATIGFVAVCGSAKIFRNGWKCWSSFSVVAAAESGVVGTLPSPSASFVSACVLVDRYLSSSHAAPSFFAPFGMPMVFPVV